MLTFPTQNLFIEGCDLSGKTTLIKKLHDLMGYRWHVYDRSQISRKIFNTLYLRKIKHIEDDYNSELNNLNNRFVILDPGWKVIKERFDNRGDEIHNVESLRVVYDEFQKIATELAGLPNVYVPVYNEEDIENRIILHLDSQENNLTLDEISEQVFSSVFWSLNNEIYSLKFTLYDDGQFKESSSSIMEDEKEKEYYEKVSLTLLRKIEDEIDGKNEYNRVEDISSRRFVYADDSCISFIQVAVRDKIMDFHCVLRSSDVDNTFCKDLKFLYYLASMCFHRLKFEGNIKAARLRFNLNSAHIVQ